MGRDRTAKYRDPRGHSLRVYADIFDSHAWAALGPFDVMVYLALLRELRGFNNGDLSLPLTRAKQCGINHHVTLARSLRALVAVGLISITRKGGSTKGGQRLPTLYRVTDRECFEVPAKHIEARPVTDEWKRVTSREHGQQLIADANSKAKKYAEKTKTLGHPVTDITSPNVLVRPETTTPRDTWPARPLHAVTMAEKGAKPMPMRVSGDFPDEYENAIHRTPRVSPLYIANHGSNKDTTVRPAITTATTSAAREPSSKPSAAWQFKEGSDAAIVLAALKAAPMSSDDLLVLGIVNPRQRIQDIRKRGYRIELLTAKGEAARYVLRAAPADEPSEVSA